MSEPRKSWLWTLLRLKKRSELDRVERDLVLGLPPERRDFAGDPQQPKHYRVLLRHKAKK